MAVVLCLFTEVTFFYFVQMWTLSSQMYVTCAIWRLLLAKTHGQLHQISDTSKQVAVDGWQFTSFYLCNITMACLQLRLKACANHGSIWWNSHKLHSFLSSISGQLHQLAALSPRKPLQSTLCIAVSVNNNAKICSCMTSAVLSQ